MNRHRRDIDDFDNLFGRDEAIRRRQERAEMIESGQQREAMLDAQEAAVSRRVSDSMLKANASFIAREYEHAGLTPPCVNAAGEPTCSLSLLLKMGWTIHDLGFGKQLVAPPPQPKYVPRGECS